MKVKAAVFASGTGSNFEAIMKTTELQCEISLLVCDKSGAKVLEKAKEYSVPTFVFDPKGYSSKQEYETVLINVLKQAEIEWIFLAGFMRIIGPTLLAAYENRIVNIHPSLLPAFPGKDAIGQAFRAGVEKTGVTVHFIDHGIDTGPIIAQKEVPIFSNDTLETLEERIHQVEHDLYSKTINQLISKEIF